MRRLLIGIAAAGVLVVVLLAGRSEPTSAAFGATDFASTFHVVPNWNFITGVSGVDQNYCAGCNGSFRLSFETATETCDGSVRPGVYGVGFNVESHSFSGNPAGPYSAFVTYGDGTTENFNFPAGPSFFGITSPDLINNIHVAVNNTPTGSGSITIDNLTLGNQVGGCGASGELSLTKTANPDPAIAGQNVVYTITATNDSTNDMQDVVITDTLPSNATYQSSAPSSGGTCAAPGVGTLGGTIVCSWPAALAVGGNRSVNITVRACAEGMCATSMRNTAVASATSVLIEGPSIVHSRPDHARAAPGVDPAGGEAVEVIVVEGIPKTIAAGSSRPDDVIASTADRAAECVQMARAAREAELKKAAAVGDDVNGVAPRVAKPASPASTSTLLQTRIQCPSDFMVGSELDEGDPT